MKRPQNVIYVGGTTANIYRRKWAFLGLFLLVFFLSHTTLSAIGLAPGRSGIVPPLPEYEPDTTSETPEQSVALPLGEGAAPDRIEIPALGIRATVANPTSADVRTLDQALLSGTVRYPGSGRAGEQGNVLIFGHSSHLPVVHNQAFKAFNEIQSLKRGDPIILYGGGKAFRYEVEKVEEANAATDAIALAVDGAHLTLATCNNFGSKEDRFIVTAKLVDIGTQRAAEPAE